MCLRHQQDMFWYAQVSYRLNQHLYVYKFYVCLYVLLKNKCVNETIKTLIHLIHTSRTFLVVLK